MDALKEAKKIDKEYNYYNEFCEVQTSKKGKLANLPISVKDCICVKDVESRAGSAILNTYKPLFNATVVDNILKEGGIIIGKTSQDTFGFGSFNTNVGIGFKIPKNPFDKTRVTGGSSGGACGIVHLSKFQTMGIAESTGGSIASPAAFCGVYGLTPTYSLVSRYGVMDYGSSLDKIGTVGKTINDVTLLLEVISGYDPKDSTSMNRKKESYSEYLTTPPKSMKVAVVKESFNNIDKDVKDKAEEKISQLENNGIKTESISLPITSKYSLAAYYILAMSEASTNLAKFQGIRYGKHEKLEGDFNEYFSFVRSNNFNTEAKRRILLGTFARMSGFRDAYYLKAAKVRTLIINEYKKIFKRFSAIITPSMPILPPKFKDIEELTPMQHYMMDILTVGPNLAGLPHLNIPLKNKLPVGMLAIADHFMEKNLIMLGTL